MIVQIWKMRARKKRAEAYEEFGRQVTLPSLKNLDGCLDAYFVKVFESRKPEYLWLVFWRDQDALETARNAPVWRDQIEKFEAGEYYKSVPVEYLCESLGLFGSLAAENVKKPERNLKATATRTRKSARQTFAESIPEVEKVKSEV